MDNFIKFLEDNDALEDYKRELQSQRGWDLTYFLNTVGPGLYLGGAFNWKGSQQGHDYWSILRDKWDEERAK